MSVENAIDTAKKILQEGNNKNLAEVLGDIDGEETEELQTPNPKEFLVGNYLGREEVLANIPCITLEARNTPEGESETGYLIKEHSLWVYGWVAEVEIEIMHRYMMRYAEGIRRLMVDIEQWGNYWFNPTVVNTMYSDVFQADHRLLQGCRVEVAVSEVYKEKA